MIIRNATIKDLSKCEELSEMPELLWVWWWHYDIDFLKNYISNDWYFLVWEQWQKIIWYLLWEKLKSQWSIIWSLWIDEKYRWKWFWTQLLKQFEKTVKINWWKWIYLVARANKEKLKQFYKKNGFTAWETNIEYAKNI